MSDIDPETSISTISLSTGQFPISQFSAKDIFLVGYPKSGNAWVQNLVAGLLYGADPSLAPDSLIQELVPDIHYQRSYKRFSAPMVFKSHHLPRPDFRRVIYLLRDGRDAVISELHHSAALDDKAVEDFDLIKFVDAAAARWAWHVEAWTRNAYAAEMMTVKFEDLFANRVEELERVSEFIGVERDSNFLVSLLERASFDRMREKAGGSNPVALQDKLLWQRGKVGIYKEEMPASVQQVFLKRAGTVLRNAGYID
ncbi:MAG: sulfotransferase domain-containing protein [Verrucomicrobiota bacterium]|nr:sulfotransferase domain-containing protein [Verrucomicrobiota bacterium]